jgi:hypothetical protein
MPGRFPIPDALSPSQFITNFPPLTDAPAHLVTITILACLYRSRVTGREARLGDGARVESKRVLVLLPRWSTGYRRTNRPASASECARDHRTGRLHRRCSRWSRCRGVFLLDGRRARRQTFPAHCQRTAGSKIFCGRSSHSFPRPWFPFRDRDRRSRNVLRFDTPVPRSN